MKVEYLLHHNIDHQEGSFQKQAKMNKEYYCCDKIMSFE